MAQVAYNQGAGPDVEPTVSAPDDYQHLQASPNAFGAALAQGAEKFGAGLMQANNFYNQSAADQATNNAVEQATKVLYGDPNVVNPDGSHDTGYYGKQGQDRMDAYGPAHQHVADILKSNAENLSPEARLHYDQYTRRFWQIEQERMGQHYDQAQRTWMLNNNVVTARQTLDEISRHAGDDGAFLGGIANLTTSYQKTNFLNGLGDAGKAEAIRDATRDAWKVRLESINADPNLGGPERAYKLAVEHKNEIGVDKNGVDEGAALVEKYQKGGQEASVVGAIKTGWAKSLNTPTSELAGTGKPRSGPPAGAVVYGDSLGAGVKAAYGYGGDAVVGRNPSQVLAAIQSAPAGSLNGKPVVLSSGASNDPASTDKTADQIAAAVSKGANPADITVMGVGDRPDLKGVNEKLQAIATKAGAKFLPIDPAKLSGDRIHPASYSGILGVSAAASPGAHVGTGQFAPGSFQSALGRTFKEEGGYAARDANGAAVNFGINQAAHPEVNVATLTREQAAQIYKRDYWDAIEGDTLSKSNPALAHVAFDSAVMSGADTAKRWMLQSGGDLAKFMDIRERFLEGLIARDPGKYGRFAAAWRTRDADLRADIGLAPAAAGGFSPSGVMGAPYTPYMPSPSSALEGAVFQPASVTTPAAEGAKPLDAPPEPETPEQKLERLAIVRDATLADALAAHPEWSMAQRQRAEVLAQQEYVQASIALQMDAHTHKVQKDALGGKIASYMLEGRYDLALGVAHDRSNAYTSQERLAIQEMIEKKSGMPDLATLGPGFHKIMDGVAAEPGSPDRIGVGDNLKILQAMNRGEITKKGAVEAMEWAARVQKSTDQLGVAERINEAIKTQANDIIHEFDIGEYHVRDPQGQKAIEKYTNAIYSEANKWRESGKDWKDFPWFDPDYSKQQMLLLYSRRERDQAKYDNEARADPKIDIAKPAPTGTDANAWSKIMAAPPIIDNGQTIVHKSVWSDVVGDLISHPDADHIAAFNASEVGKASGFDAETLIQGMTGRVPDVQRGSGAPTPGIARPHVRTEQERKMLDVGGALRSLFHLGEAHPLKREIPAGDQQ